jgi:hypothetical protein
MWTAIRPQSFAANDEAQRAENDEAQRAENDDVNFDVVPF